MQQVNKKTRTAGYELLVSIAHELDEARPLTVITSRRGPVSDDGGEAMDSGDDDQQQQLEGGLLDFVNAVMAGLVGSSPHMQVGRPGRRAVLLASGLVSPCFAASCCAPWHNSTHAVRAATMPLTTPPTVCRRARAGSPGVRVCWAAGRRRVAAAARGAAAAAQPQPGGHQGSAGLHQGRGCVCE